MFEFKCGDNEYRYAEGEIQRKNSLGHWCALFEFEIGDYSQDIQIMMCISALIGYGYGILEGREQKMREIRKAFGVRD